MHIVSKNLFLSLFIVVASLLFASVLVVFATSKDDIVYPLVELGKCKNETECRAYCDAGDNLEKQRTCIAFAKKHNLLSPAELQEAEYYVIARGITQGPGGCKDQKACDVYCEDTAHLNECLDFAEQHNLRSADEIAEGRKVAVTLAGGANLPGGCRNQKECLTYCDDASHMKECVAFAEKAGFISSEEAAEAQKIIPLMEKGEKTPGNCNRKAACEAYCYEPSHIDECLLFAEKAGLIPAEELAEAKRVAPFLKRGETPGGCRRQAECELYCSDAGHFEECIAFAQKAGLMDAKDVERARKTKGLGPGGCKSSEECERFCRESTNQEVCLTFVKEHGLEGEFGHLEAEARGKIDAELRACSEKPCEEMIECLQGVQGRAVGSAGSEGQKEGEGGDNTKGLPADIKGKLDVCTAEITKKFQDAAGRNGGGGGGGGEHPAPVGGSVPDRTPPSGVSGDAAKEYQRQYEEEYKKQYDAEYKRQYEEQVKSQVDCSLFGAAPTCDYAGAPGSDNYKYCKICFPNK